MRGQKPTHGHCQKGRQTKTYKTWSSMLTRCYNQKRKDYPRYGGRGITVCERWKDFLNFLADMGEKKEGMSLDRIDVNGNYDVRNCRWASDTTQARNTRVNKLTLDLARQIRKIYQDGKIGQIALAKAFGVTQTQIHFIVTNKQWREE